MTILETNIYRTLLDVEKEKVLAGIEPTHTLLIKDRLHERVQQRMSQTISWSDFYRALQNLDFNCKIHLGDTTTDQYAKIIYREIPSSL